MQPTACCKFADRWDRKIISSQGLNFWRIQVGNCRCWRSRGFSLTKFCQWWTWSNGCWVGSGRNGRVRMRRWRLEMKTFVLSTFGSSILKPNLNEIGWCHQWSSQAGPERFTNLPFTDIIKISARPTVQLEAIIITSKLFKWTDGENSDHYRL